MDIKGVIKRYGISMTDIAAKMGTSKGYISQLASGNPEPTLRKLQELADIIGCQRYEFFEDEIIASGSMIVKNQASAEQQTASAQTDGQQPEQEELPFDKQPSQEQQPQGTTLVGLVRCPQCGHSIRLFAEE